MKLRLPLLTLVGAAGLLLAAACSGSEAARDDDSTNTPPSETPVEVPADTPQPSGEVPVVTDPTVAPPLPTAPPAGPDTPVTSPPSVEKPEPPTTDPPPAPAPGDQPFAVIPALAPIVSVDLAIAESFPPQYFVGVVSAQPNGCERFSHVEVSRDGNAVEISVYNTVPKHPEVALCAAIYGETTSNVALGSDFEPGETYTVSVNGEQQLRFVAQ